MAKWLKGFFGEIRPNLLYDIAKYLFFGAVSMIVGAIYYLYRSWHGQPRDLALIGLIVAVSFLLMALGFLITTRVGRNLRLSQNAGRNEADANLEATDAHRHRIQELWAQLEDARRKLDIAEARYTEVGWIVDRAKHQAKQVDAVLEMTGCQFGQAELTRRDPYVEILIDFYNRSIFDLELMELRGSIKLDGREFREALTWMPPHADRIIWAHNRARLTLRQNLTDEDVAHIRKARGHLDFNSLELRAKGHGECGTVVRPQKVTWRLSPTNQPLVEMLGDAWS
jgi:hypothetical protein